MRHIAIEPHKRFQAIADPMRFRILKLLIDSREETCLCELVDCFEEPKYKISRHLKILRQSKILLAEKEGRWKYYRVNYEEACLVYLGKMISLMHNENSLYKKDLYRFRKIKKSLPGNRCKNELSNPLQTHNKVDLKLKPSRKNDLTKDQVDV